MNPMKFNLNAPPAGDAYKVQVALAVEIDDAGDLVVTASHNGETNTLFELRAESGDLRVFQLAGDFQNLFATDSKGRIMVDLQ